MLGSLNEKIREAWRRKNKEEMPVTPEAFLREADNLIQQHQFFLVSMLFEMIGLFFDKTFVEPITQTANLFILEDVLDLYLEGV